MKILSAVLVLAPTLAFAQVRVEVSLPGIRFEVPPPVVVVTPGVQVVEDYDEEVFVTDGYYWIRRDGRWYRARDHRGEWVLVKKSRVPKRIVSVPHGKYRRYKRHHDRHHDRHQDVKHAGHKHKKHKHKD